MKSILKQQKLVYRPLRNTLQTEYEVNTYKTKRMENSPRLNEINKEINGQLNGMIFIVVFKE